MFVQSGAERRLRRSSRPVIGYLEAESFFGRVQSDGRSRALAGVLRSILQRFDAAEVNRCLDLWVVAAMRIRFESGRNVRTAGGVGERFLRPRSSRSGGGAAGQGTEVPHRLVDPAAKLSESHAAPGPVRWRRDRSEVRLERTRCCSTPSCEVALDPAPLAVAAAASVPATPPLLRLSLKLADACSSDRVGRYEDEAGLARELGESASTSSSSCDSSRCSTMITRTALHRARPVRPEQRPPRSASRSGNRIRDRTVATTREHAKPTARIR